jgi:DNA-binding response OmpR family regulator
MPIYWGPRGLRSFLSNKSRCSFFCRKLSIKHAAGQQAEVITLTKKILIAEDEPVLRMLIMDTLEDEGYDMAEAADGEEALSLMQGAAFDLIILDYMMPRMTGVEVIERARLLPGRDQTRILMLSAKNQQAEQDKVLQAGADSFMSKPFSPLELIDRVEEMLRG